MKGQRMPGCALLAIRSDHEHFPERSEHQCQRLDSRRPYAVVVTDEDDHSASRSPPHTTGRRYAIPPRADNAFLAPRDEARPLCATGAPFGIATRAGRARRGVLQSGWPDLNRRPHAPQACALPGCATPRVSASANAGRVPRATRNRNKHSAVRILTAREMHAVGTRASARMRARVNFDRSRTRSGVNFVALQDAMWSERSHEPTQLRGLVSPTGSGLRFAVLPTHPGIGT
jgi:hypothetical protein